MEFKQKQKSGGSPFNFISAFKIGSNPNSKPLAPIKETRPSIKPISDTPILLESPSLEESKENAVVDELSCADTESISGSTFAYLLSESLNGGKGFIVARVKTKSNQDIKKVFYHYFYAANIIQILIKPNLSFLESVFNLDNFKLNPEENRKSILRSRYHCDFPMTVKNPLTN